MFLTSTYDFLIFIHSCLFIWFVQFRTAHNNMRINLLRVYFHSEQRAHHFVCELILGAWAGYIPDSWPVSAKLCQQLQQQFICLSFDTTS